MTTGKRFGENTGKPFHQVIYLIMLKVFKTRTIVATNRGDHWFFLYGFGKNERASIDKDELKFFQEVARELLGFNEHQLVTALAAKEIVEVCDDNDKTEK